MLATVVVGATICASTGAVFLMDPGAGGGGMALASAAAAAATKGDEIFIRIALDGTVVCDVGVGIVGVTVDGGDTAIVAG